MSISDIICIALSVLFAIATIITMGLFFIGASILTKAEKEDVLL